MPNVEGHESQQSFPRGNLLFRFRLPYLPLLRASAGPPLVLTRSLTKIRLMNVNRYFTKL